ncbi:MAG TPA: hypothetical protein VNL77_20685 [Roseiflexaceae bacterium]|nr:hypothetical protein [Roseiflexaceae bacterium]
MFAPVLAHFTRAIPGGPVAGADGPQNIWNLWWVQRAVASLQSPFYTTYLYHPHGTGLYLQTLNASNGLLVLPVTALFGPVAGYNAALLLAFVLSGLGAYLLALRVSGSRPAAFVGGAIFAFSPFHLTKAWDGQLEQVALQWTAFYTLFLLRAAEDLRGRDALLAGLFLALVGYTSWYSLFFFAVYTALFALIWLAAARSWQARRALAVQLVIMGLCAALLLAPILLPTLRALSGAGGGGGEPFDPSDPLDLILIHSANLYDFFLPSGLHPLWGDAVARLAQRWHPYIAAWNVALGYLPLALALAAFLPPLHVERSNVQRWTFKGGIAWPWALLALASLLLALGPVLHVGTVRTGLRLPYALLLALPGADIARRPSHFVVVATLMLAPLAALGLRATLERVRPARRPLLLALVGLTLALELLPPPWPLRRFEPHPYYTRLRGAGGALMDMPARAESAAPLLAQIVHELPIVGGYVSRLPPYPFATTVPGVRQLWQGAPDSPALLPAAPDDGLIALNYYGVRHVVVHWEALAGGARRRYERALAQALPGVVPTYTDDRLSAYRVPPTLLRPLAFFGPGWHQEEQDGARHWRWMQAEGEIVLVNPGAASRPVTLLLAAQSPRAPRAAALAFDGAPLGTWQITEAGDAHILRLLVPPGEHRLALRAPAAPAPGDPRMLSIALVAAEARWGE